MAGERWLVGGAAAASCRNPLCGFHRQSTQSNHDYTGFQEPGATEFEMVSCIHVYWQMPSVPANWHPSCVWRRPVVCPAWSWIWPDRSMFGLDWPSGLGLSVKCDGHEVNRPERSDIRFRGRARPLSDWSNCGNQTLPANWDAAWLGRRPPRSRTEDTWALVDRSLHRRTGMRPQVHRPLPVATAAEVSGMSARTLPAAKCDSRRSNEPS